MLLLYLEEHPYAEISEILGITVTNLTTKINRLKERLRSLRGERTWNSMS